MNNDGVNFAASTSTGLILWLSTFSAILPALWVLYVVILIAIKLPELYEKNPWFRRIADWVSRLFSWGRPRG